MPKPLGPVSVRVKPHTRALRWHAAQQALLAHLAQGTPGKAEMLRRLPLFGVALEGKSEMRRLHGEAKRLERKAA